MSRYPWDEYAQRYLDSMVGIWSDMTHKGVARRLRRMGLDIRSEFERKKISTTSPRTMTPDDVRVHLVYRRSLGQTPSEYSHELTCMTSFFDFCENTAVRACLRKYPGLRPARGLARHQPLDDEDVSTILDRMSSVPQIEDYRLLRSYAMLAVFLGCGCRTKELRLIDLRDLDTDEWVLEIVHVKGEASYGSSRSVPVPPVFRSVLSAYLKARSDNCPEGSIALFPSVHHSLEGHLSANTIRKTLGFALDDLGIDTDPRTLRRTFGQQYLDSGIDSIESVSVLMGHSSTSTTERYYARRRNEKAIEAARRTWADEEDSSNTSSTDHAEGNEPVYGKNCEKVRTPGFEPEF